MPEGKGSGEDDDVFPLTVLHFAGETEIPAYLYEAFPDQQEALDACTNVGGRSEPDIEEIANLEPDLILLNQAGTDDESVHDSLSAIAPTLVTQGTGLSWKQDLLLLADAIAKRQEAETWSDDFHTRAAEAGAGISGDPTVSLLRRNRDRIRVFGVASFGGSVLEDAAVARPEGQAFTDETSVDLSQEDLADADADWILFGVQGGDATEITDLALCPPLGSVEADQAVQVDDDTFYLNTGPTAASLVLVLLESTL